MNSKAVLLPLASRGRQSTMLQVSICRSQSLGQVLTVSRRVAAVSDCLLLLLVTGRRAAPGCVLWLHSMLCVSTADSPGDSSGQVTSPSEGGSSVKMKSTGLLLQVDACTVTVLWSSVTLQSSRVLLLCLCPQEELVVEAEMILFGHILCIR